MRIDCEPLKYSNWWWVMPKAEGQEGIDGVWQQKCHHCNLIRSGGFYNTMSIESVLIKIC